MSDNVLYCEALFSGLEGRLLFVFINLHLLLQMTTIRATRMTTATPPTMAASWVSLSLTEVTPAVVVPEVVPLDLAETRGLLSVSLWPGWNTRFVVSLTWLKHQVCCPCHWPVHGAGRISQFNTSPCLSTRMMCSSLTVPAIHFLLLCWFVAVVDC